MRAAAASASSAPSGAPPASPPALPPASLASASDPTLLPALAALWSPAAQHALLCSRRRLHRWMLQQASSRQPAPSCQMGCQNLARCYADAARFCGGGRDCASCILACLAGVGAAWFCVRRVAAASSQQCFAASGAAHDVLDAVRMPPDFSAVGEIVQVASARLSCRRGCSVVCVPWVAAARRR